MFTAARFFYYINKRTNIVSYCVRAIVEKLLARCAFFFTRILDRILGVVWKSSVWWNNESGELIKIIHARKSLISFSYLQQKKKNSFTKIQSEYDYYFDYRVF